MMQLLKNLALVVFLVIGLCSSTFAAGETEESSLETEKIAKMSCSEATKQLKEKIELQQQLGQAYLQTYQAFHDVYEIWGAKLAKSKNLEEVSKIAAFFKSSAAATKEALKQSSQEIEVNKRTTNLLMARVTVCSQRE